MVQNATATSHDPIYKLALALALLSVFTGSLLATQARATPGIIDTSREQGLLCRRAIQQAEIRSNLPQNLLIGIARVESGRRDPISGRFHPWPWTINAEGKGYFFKTKDEAIIFARQLQERGVRSFDVGCMQVNMMHHAGAFQDLEEAFDPAANARYAVKFLGQLKEKSGNWETASAWYHSANPEYGIPYRGMVASAMVVEAKNPTEYTSLLDSGSLSSNAGNHANTSSMRSMPTGLGTVMYLANGGGGQILPRSYPSFANGGIPAMPQSAIPASSGMGGFGAPAGFGRSLDAYRMQPVPMVGPRLAAIR